MCSLQVKLTSFAATAKDAPAKAPTKAPAPVASTPPVASSVTNAANSSKNDRSELLSKSLAYARDEKMCSYFKNFGKCNKGDSCSFSHETGEDFPVEKSKICFSFEETGRCKNGDRCRFSHASGSGSGSGSGTKKKNRLLEAAAEQGITAELNSKRARFAMLNIFVISARFS